MEFINELQKKTSIPLAIHIMDDSISFLNKPNLLYFYWRQKTKSVFQQLIDRSVVSLSISQFMSDEYYKRYKKIFIPIRNPVELSQWLPYIKNDWEVSDTINVVYTGRLAIPNINSLYRFCEVVDSLNKLGRNIKFDIYSIDDNRSFRKKIKYFRGIYVNSPIPYGDIPKLIPKYDILLLPIDFNKTGIKYAKYSISTKTSEYMISGVPILLIAPKEVALTSYAIENNCMLSVSEDKIEKITNALVRLINDKSLRESLAKKAFDVVKKDSDANYVRQKFKFLLSSKSKI
jgi:glycosyltransferase involved in cell wall biosynthesis